MKKQLAVGAILLWSILCAVVMVLPEDTMQYSKGMTYLIVTIPLIIGLMVIGFTKMCPSCGAWLAHLRKRRCSTCGTEVN